MERKDYVSDMGLKLNALSEDELKLLCFAAYYGKYCRGDILAKYSKFAHLGEKTMGKLCMSLSSKRFAYYWGDLRPFQHFASFSIETVWKLPALKTLYKNHQEWAIEFADENWTSTHYESKARSIHDPINLIMHQLVDGKVPASGLTLGNILYSELVDTYHHVLIDPDLRPLIRMFPSNTLYDLAIGTMQYMMGANYLMDTSVLDDIINDPKNIVHRQALESERALYEYMAYGKLPDEISGSDYRLHALLGFVCMHKQNYAKALDYISTALKLRNRQAEVKNIFDSGVLTYFMTALYIKINDTTCNTKLQQLVNKRKKVTSLYHEAAFLMAEMHLNSISSKNLKDHLAYMLRKGTEDINFAIVKIEAQFLAKLWEVDADKKTDKCVMPEYAILRHEFQAFLPLDESEKQRLNDIYGTPTLVAARPKPKWEQLLDAIVDDSFKANDNRSANPTERMIYLTRSYYEEKIFPCTQTWLKSGRWSKYKELSTGMYEKGLDCMDAIDRKIWQACGKDTYRLKKEIAFPLLVGMDKVYFDNYSAELNPVNIRCEKPRLSITKEKNGFKFTSNIKNPKPGVTSYVIKESPTNYIVIHTSEEESDLYAKLLKIKSMPIEAETKLKETLPFISMKTELDTPLEAAGIPIEDIEGSAAIVLQAKQISSDGLFNVKAYARPLEGGHGYLMPGRGAAIVLDIKDEKRYNVKRKLLEEKKNADGIAVFIEDCGKEGENMDISEGNYSFTISVAQMLDLMDYVRSNSDTYSMEWPEGERLKLFASPKSTSWNVGLHSVGGWFEIEGDVTIDEQTKVSVAQIIASLGNGKSNYIKLSDNEYVRLTDSLRKQLAKLEALSMKSKDTLLVPINNASLLADAVKGEMEIGNTENLTAMCDKIKKSYTLMPKVPNNLQATLRDYQTEGFRWMARLDSWGAGACLADDMGLGKTVQTIAMLLYNARKGASLVVAPTSVVGNWQNELERFAPSLHVTLLNDSEDRTKTINEADARDVILTTYGILSIETDLITGKEWNVVCLDEAHTIKNRETKMAHAVHQLKASTRIALTGTPLQNHLGELWSLFNFINPGLLGNYDFFRQKFVVPIESGNKERQQQLRRIVLPFMLRRTKNEVIEELPDKTEVVRKVELSDEEMTAYEVFRNAAKDQLKKEGKVSVSVLAEITKLRQAACCTRLVNPELKFQSSKIEHLLQLLDNIGEGGNRILIFSQFTSFLKMVKTTLDKANVEYLYLDGATPMKQRMELVRRFQDGESRIFIISLKAGGLGLNLTGANYVIHMDPWWNPAIEQQATDRAYRIGQEQKVTVYHLIAAHTIEEKILRLHETKRALADTLLEGADVSHKLTEEDLQELLK